MSIGVGIAVGRRGWRARVLAGGCAALICALLVAGPASAGLPGTWTPAASLATGRFFHVSATLPGGGVLVAGGESTPGTATNSAERYHPAANTWTSASAMSIPRLLGTAASLADGKVLVAGGMSSSSPSDAQSSGEVYDPATNAWTPMANTMSAARGLVPVSARLPSGKVLVAGGADASANPLASADIYDPASNTFTPAAPMSDARAFASAILLPSGKVLVVGGQDVNGGAPTATAEVYDPATNSWSAVHNSMSVSRQLPGMALLRDGKVLVVGGVSSGSTSGAPATTTATTDLYDPSTNSFSPGPDLAISRGNFGITTLADGRVLIAGGVTLHGSSGAPTGDAEIYDPASNRWSQAGALPRVGGLTLNLLPNGDVLAAGGSTNFNSGSTQAEIFTPSSPRGTPPQPHFRIVLHTTPLTISPHGDVPIRLKCLSRARAACSGTVTIRLAQPVPPPVDALVSRCARGCRPLGTAHFHAQAGRMIRVRVHLSAYGRRLLAQSGTLRVTVTASGVSGGRTTTTVGTITLRARTGSTSGVGAPRLFVVSTLERSRRYPPGW
jgi:N-acetylneuraminic acid mutarotase